MEAVTKGRRGESGGGGDQALPANFRHNFVALLVDYTSFSAALAFVNPSVVLPAFASTLTNLEPLIGLVGTVMNASWLLPQLGAAALIGGRPRKKPYLMAALCAGRPFWFVLALGSWFLLPHRPMAALGVLYACVGIFFFLDAVASVAWFDIMARAVPLARRGRLIGAGQLVSGLLGIGIGPLVALILASPRFPYPTNYALLFVLAGLVIIPSTVALGMLREPEGTDLEPRRTVLDFLRQLGGVWRGDGNFRRLMGFRWLIGLMNLAVPFYVLHAEEIIGLSEGMAGWFVLAQTVGGIAASVSLGWLSERRGPRAVIWVGAATALLSPLVALGVHFFHQGVLQQVYLMVYFLLGVTNSSWLLGPLNYVLEIAPQGRRPLYVGLYNTLAGLLVPASFLGGVLLRVTSYPVLFGVTAGGIAAALWISLRLKRSGQEAA